MPVKTITVEEARLLGAKIGKLGTRRKRRGKNKIDYAARFALTPKMPQLSDAEKQCQRELFDRHDDVLITIRLPLAPSMNHYWRSWVRPGSKSVMTYVSDEGKAFKEAVAAAWINYWKGWPPDPLTCRLRLLVSVHYFTNMKIDLDNRVKPLQDALTECKVWEDDSQIDDLRVIRGPIVAKPGYMDVTIESIL